MVKYQKILRVVLLTAMMSSTLPGAFASSGAGEGSGGFPVDPDRFALLSEPVKVRGTYQRHQLKSLELQYRIRDLEKGAAENPTYRGHLINLIYLKFKTVYNLGRGFVGKPLETSDRSFIEKVESKYEGLSGRAQGTIISPFKDMVELLHQIGIGPDLIAGLDDEVEGSLNSEFFFLQIFL